MAVNKAIFAGGCFWCTEAIFKELEGVDKVVSGYIGGKVKDPTYREVCGGRTGHAEAVQIEYDDQKIDYKSLLKIFFTTHDPTTLNRQGADVGTQYRSAVFYLSEDQKSAAEQVIREIEEEGIYEDQIVTTLEEATTFYPAEDYHQNYFENNPDQPYCSVVINPKVSKFRERYRQVLK